MQRLVLPPVFYRIDLVSAIEDCGRTHQSDFRNFPGTVLQRLVGNGTGIFVEVDQFRFSVYIQLHHQTDTADPVIGKVRQFRVLHVIRAAVKKKDRRKSTFQCILNFLVCPDVVVYHHFHIFPFFLIVDEGFHINRPWISGVIGLCIDRAWQ